MMLPDAIFLHHFPADKMAGDDLLKHIGRAVFIPNTFRINDGDRAFAAYLQAIYFAAHDAALAA